MYACMHASSYDALYLQPGHDGVDAVEWIIDCLQLCFLICFDSGSAGDDRYTTREELHPVGASMMVSMRGNHSKQYTMTAVHDTDALDGQRISVQVAVLEEGATHIVNKISKLGRVYRVSRFHVKQGVDTTHISISDIAKQCANSSGKNLLHTPCTGSS